MYVTIQPDGTVAEFEGKPSLEDLQREVGGNVEVIELRRDDENATIWMNEDGKHLGLPVNRQADRLAHLFTGIAPADVVVGPIVVTGSADDDGEVTDLTANWFAYLRDMARLGAAETA